jgi:hypothetical protein
MVAVGTWVAVTLVLVAAALAKGQAHAIHWLPDPGAFSGGAAEVSDLTRVRTLFERLVLVGVALREFLSTCNTAGGVQPCIQLQATACLPTLCRPADGLASDLGNAAPVLRRVQVATRIVAVLPVLATAYTCQMTIHHILRDMQPLTQSRVKKMSVRRATATLSTAVAALHEPLYLPAEVGRHRHHFLPAQDSWACLHPLSLAYQVLLQQLRWQLRRQLHVVANKQPIM